MKRHRHIVLAALFELHHTRNYREIADRCGFPKAKTGRLMREAREFGLVSMTWIPKGRTGERVGGWQFKLTPEGIREVLEGESQLRDVATLF